MVPAGNKAKCRSVNHTTETIHHHLHHHHQRLWEQARNRYRKLSNEGENIKREYERNRYQNMSEENKQRLKKYQKNYCKAKKISIKKIFFFIYMV